MTLTQLQKRLTMQKNAIIRSLTNADHQLGIKNKRAIQDNICNLEDTINSILLGGVIKSEESPPYKVEPLPITLSEVAQNQLIDKAIKILDSRLHTTDLTITSPQDTIKYLRLKLQEEEREVFVCLFLNNRHQLIEYEELFKGTIDGASVYPREVVKRALQLNAAALIIAHNHPSGVAEPSQADEQITIRLQKALATVDIRLLDHLIVGGVDTTSLAERGVI